MKLLAMQTMFLMLSMKTLCTLVVNVNCIVFINLYSASHSMSLSEALPNPDHSNDTVTVSEFTRRSATGKRRPCPKSLRGGYRAGFEPTTLRSKGLDPANAPPHNIYMIWPKTIMPRTGLGDILYHHCRFQVSWRVLYRVNLCSLPCWNTAFIDNH